MGEWQKGKEFNSKIEDNVVVRTIKKNYTDVDIFNGGDTDKILETVEKGNYNIVFWFVKDIDDDTVLFRIKQTNFKIILIVCETIGNEPFMAALGQIFKVKINLLFLYDEGIFKCIDPLGNLWYEGKSIEECIQKSVDRINFLNGIKRESTIQADEEIGSLAWYFNQFKQEYVQNNDITKEEVDESELLELVKKYAKVYTKETTHSDDVEKVLANPGFRCIKGLPSFRHRDVIYVTKRTITNMYIENEDFVPMISKEGQLYYQGNSKPTVDSPIQIKLYEHFPNINYILHSHCYIDGAVFTSKNYPCGAIEEVEEILRTIQEAYKTFDKDFYVVNLVGHGSYAMGRTVKDLENIKYIGRKMPEKMY